MTRGGILERVVIKIRSQIGDRLLGAVHAGVCFFSTSERGVGLRLRAIGAAPYVRDVGGESREVLRVAARRFFKFTGAILKRSDSFAHAIAHVLLGCTSYRT